MNGQPTAAFGVQLAIIGMEIAPHAHHAWGVDATVDLPASDEEGELVLRDVGLTQL